MDRGVIAALARRFAGLIFLLFAAGLAGAQTPQRIIAQGTDWRFLNELKRELK